MIAAGWFLLTAAALVYAVAKAVEVIANVDIELDVTFDDPGDFDEHADQALAVASVMTEQELTDQHALTITHLGQDELAARRAYHAGGTR